MQPLALRRAAAAYAGDATRVRAEIAELERVLHDGTPVPGSQVTIGGGMNGTRTKVLLADPLHRLADTPAVEKSVAQQAAQERFGWRVAQALGIDHLFAAVAQRADGSVGIEFRPGVTLREAGITTVEQLQSAIERMHLAAGATESQARDRARIDRQLFQVYDYVLANSDRHLGQGMADAISGVVSFVDQGNMGRGAILEGASILRPALREFQAGPHGGTVDIDPDVVDLVRERLTPDRLRTLHTGVFADPSVATPPAGTIGNEYLAEVNGFEFREGSVKRLEQVLEHGSYEHAPEAADPILHAAPPEERLANARGVGAVKGAFFDLDL